MVSRRNHRGFGLIRCRIRRHRGLFGLGLRGERKTCVGRTNLPGRRDPGGGRRLGDRSAAILTAFETGLGSAWAWRRRCWRVGVRHRRIGGFAGRDLQDRSSGGTGFAHLSARSSPESLPIHRPRR